VKAGGSISLVGWNLTAQKCRGNAPIDLKRFKVLSIETLKLHYLQL
jgi:hypothetical protein